MIFSVVTFVVGVSFNLNVPFFICFCFVTILFMVFRYMQITQGLYTYIPYYNSPLFSYLNLSNLKQLIFKMWDFTIDLQFSTLATLGKE